ncbi:MAG: hypothetical protein H7306_15425 [Bacteriovorax sp.]|nr:hypothetical protein [Rhizobacter sp.]
MPLVDEKFKPFGIKGWRVLKAVGTPFGGKPAYSIIDNLEFDTDDQFRAAVAAHPARCSAMSPISATRAPSS